MFDQGPRKEASEFQFREERGPRFEPRPGADQRWPNDLFSNFSSSQEFPTVRSFKPQRRRRKPHPEPKSFFRPPQEETVLGGQLTLLYVI